MTYSHTLDLPLKFILLDTEYTAWEGSQERKWSGPNEHKEIVQIGAILVDNAALTEIDMRKIYVKPTINPILSDYFIDLTGVTQDEVERSGATFPSALAQLKEWCGDTPVYSFGYDGVIMEENCALIKTIFPFSPAQFHDMRDFFKLHGIPADDYFSSTITEAFGKKSSYAGHDALNDVRTILDGLRALKAHLSSIPRTIEL
jgi:inhibitor of KinA sporulation pathway (predicted exonuclease)